LHIFFLLFFPLLSSFFFSFHVFLYFSFLHFQFLFFFLFSLFFLFFFHFCRFENALLQFDSLFLSRNVCVGFRGRAFRF
jgi:hypothetical protein